MVLCHLVETLLILSFYLSNSETFTCSNSECSCATKNEECNVQCLSSEQCKNKSITCNQGYPCDIDCRDNNSTSTESCINATINSNNATNLTVHCSEYNDCKSTTINCNNSQFCNVICQSTNSVSTSGICEELTLNCGTSHCNIICDNNTNTCSNIKVNISLANSFKCIGSNISCLYAPNPIINSSNPITLPITLAPSTPSPILRIPHVTPFTNNNNNMTSIIFMTEILAIETINIDLNTNNNNLFIHNWFMNHPLLILLVSGIITFSICLCIILYCFIKQKYEFDNVCNDNKNKNIFEHKNENIQIKKSTNLAQIYNDKKRYRHRIETQSHISFSINNYMYENSEINDESMIINLSKKQHISSFNISPSTNNTNNISPHLPLPITPINEYKEQPVSPILSNININNNIILPPPYIINYNNMNNEGLDKEKITMAINEVFIINKNDMYCEESVDSIKEQDDDDDYDDIDYDNIMTDDGDDYNNPNIKDDEFVIKGDDDSQYNETKGINNNENNNDNEQDLSIVIDDDMISIMSISNVSCEEGLIQQRKNKKLAFEIDPIEENLCNNIQTSDIDAISL